MAPPPLPPDYGNSAGGWAAAAPAPAASTAPANDDWGWGSSGNTETNSRYQNTPADDPWSSNNADNNFNQAGSSNPDPFDPFDQPPKQSSTAPPPITASANQVTCQNPDLKSGCLFMF